MNFLFQMKVPLWLMCPKEDTGQECSVNVPSFWVNLVCYRRLGLLCACAYYSKW